MTADEMRAELLESDSRLRGLLMLKLRLERRAREAKAGMNGVKEEIVQDVSKNPEDYGFPLGARVGRALAVATAMSSSECSSRGEELRRMVDRIMRVNVELDVLKARMENLRCVLASL